MISSTFLAADGDGYEQQMGRWSRRLAEPFLDFVGVAQGERILDVGCGTGSLSFAVAARCPDSEILGIDISPVYVAHAAAHNAAFPNLRFALGDACMLTVPTGSYDSVLSLLMLHFVPKADEAVAHMRRVGRSKATVAAAVWDARGGFVSNRMFFDTAAALDPAANARRAKNYTRPMTRPGELAQAWRDAGLCDVVDTALAIRMEFSSFDDYWAPCEGKDGPTADYVGSLSSEMRDRLRDAVRLAYLDGEADGPRSYAATAWAVKGQVP